VCGLAHYLEREGIPTVAIGLIARHASLIKPPRALTVPFELGRPFGAPEDAALQRWVIECALGLLERTDGPVLETFDYPRETADGGSGWSSPIPPAPDLSLANDAESFTTALRSEIVALEPAFAKWSAAGGRRLDRVSGLSPAEAAALVLRLAGDPAMESPREGYTATLAVKFAADDLKHAYYQAALSQPGAPSDVEVDDWFFGETLAGKLLFCLRDALLAAEDEAIRGFASHAFVPSHQAHRAQT
jgi:hypothetical protein